MIKHIKNFVILTIVVSMLVGSTYSNSESGKVAVAATKTTEPTKTSMPTATSVPTEIPTLTPTPTYSKYVVPREITVALMNHYFERVGREEDYVEKMEDGWYFYVQGKTISIGFGEIVEPGIVQFKINDKTIKTPYGTFIDIVIENVAEPNKAPAIWICAGIPLLLEPPQNRDEPPVIIDGKEYYEVKVPRSMIQINILRRLGVTISIPDENYDNEWCLEDPYPPYEYDPNFYEGYMLPNGQEFFWGRMEDGTVSCPTVEFVN